MTKPVRTINPKDAVYKVVRAGDELPPICHVMGVVKHWNYDRFLHYIKNYGAEGINLFDRGIVVNVGAYQSDIAVIVDKADETTESNEWGEVAP